MSATVKMFSKYERKSFQLKKINFANFVNLEIYTPQFYKIKGILDVRTKSLERRNK